MADTPSFTLRLHPAERVALAGIIQAGRDAGRRGLTASDAVRAALRFAARNPAAAFGNHGGNHSATPEGSP
jgi:hypothetical protein